eukprot:165010-Amphidinium_carterae.1
MTALEPQNDEMTSARDYYPLHTMQQLLVLTPICINRARYLDDGWLYIRSVFGAVYVLERLTWALN